MKYLSLFIITIFIFICFLFALNKNDKDLKSVFINKEAPEFNLKSLKKNNLSNKDFENEILLVNFFASWCIPCIVEHDFLFELKKQKEIKIYGINYKDNIKDLENWLNKLGNPYTKIGIDKSGLNSIDWGVNGIPESFLIDKDGIIRHKVNGIIDNKQIKILIEKIDYLEKK
tara:strand:+ start:319 stop:834 length:516 start_codon:yes stop_codon:yes gene_type:complete